LARAIHDLSPRRKKPFVPVNCAALPDTLLESELFGYKAGAFTDAKKDKAGLFSVANGGSIFFDEIGEISPAFQVRLLRVLQDQVLDLVAADLLAAAKAIVEHVDRALDLKYADRAHQLRLAAGKDTGVVHFDDGHVRITADLPKKVDWDQTRLAEITRRIAANGDDPSEYVDISYRISETKFNAWPESLKSAFAPARTLKTGKPGFRLALLQEESP